APVACARALEGVNAMAKSAMTAASAAADRTKPLLLSVSFESAASAISESSMLRPSERAHSFRSLRAQRKSHRSARPPVASVVDRVTDNRAGHAVSAATSAAQLGAGDGDYLDARLSQQRVGVDVAVVGENDAGGDADEIGAA